MASLLGRATRLCAKQTVQALSKCQGQAAEATSALFPKQAWSSRGFAAGSGHGHGDVTHAGLTLHKPGQWHRIATEVATGTMWFWLFVRFYHDGEGLFFGHAAHYDHEALHDKAHDAVHGAQQGHGDHEDEETQEAGNAQPQPAG